MAMIQLCASWMQRWLPHSYAPITTAVTMQAPVPLVGLTADCAGHIIICISMFD
jgi:hypothetical protein